MILKLSKCYQSIHGLPVIHSIDTEIFEKTYFMHCMECKFCNDQCCTYGSIVDMKNFRRIMKYADELEKFTGIKRRNWFYPGTRKWDNEFPGHIYTRTSRRKNACIFLNRNSKGCMLHSFAYEKGLDYHLFKPLFCSIFPVTFNEGVLVTPEEVDDNTLACLGKGPNLYHGARDALIYYFGEKMVDNIDMIEINYKKAKKVRLAL